MIMFNSSSPSSSHLSQFYQRYKLKFMIEEIRIKKKRTLDLSQQNIISLPEPLINYDDSDHFNHITRLYLQKNKLREIPSDLLKTMNKLNVFLLDYNPLESLPDSSFSQLKFLTRLNISHTRLNCLPKCIFDLQTLKLLWANQIGLIEIPNEIGKLNQLTILGLRNNCITSLPEQLFELKKLKRLSLANNRIEIIPESISQLKNLIRLNLNQNRISYFPKIWANLIKLEYFTITKNLLEVDDKLIRSIKKLAHLKKCDLTGNPKYSKKPFEGLITKQTQVPSSDDEKDEINSSLILTKRKSVSSAKRGYINSENGLQKKYPYSSFQSTRSYLENQVYSKSESLSSSNTFSGYNCIPGEEDSFSSNSNDKIKEKDKNLFCPSVGANTATSANTTSKSQNLRRSQSNPSIDIDSKIYFKSLLQKKIIRKSKSMLSLDISKAEGDESSLEVFCNYNPLCNGKLHFLLDDATSDKEKDKNTKEKVSGNEKVTEKREELNEEEELEHFSFEYEYNDNDNDSLFFDETRAEGSREMNEREEEEENENAADEEGNWSDSVNSTDLDSDRTCSDFSDDEPDEILNLPVQESFSKIFCL